MPDYTYLRDGNTPNVEEQWNQFEVSFVKNRSLIQSVISDAVKKQIKGDVIKFYRNGSSSIPYVKKGFLSKRYSYSSRLWGINIRVYSNNKRIKKVGFPFGIPEVIFTDSNENIQITIPSQRMFNSILTDICSNLREEEITLESESLSISSTSYYDDYALKISAQLGIL